MFGSGVESGFDLLFGEKQVSKIVSDVSTQHVSDIVAKGVREFKYTECLRWGGSSDSSCYCVSANYPRYCNVETINYTPPFLSAWISYQISFKHVHQFALAPQKVEQVLSSIRRCVYVLFECSLQPLVGSRLSHSVLLGDGKMVANSNKL